MNKYYAVFIQKFSSSFWVVYKKRKFLWPKKVGEFRCYDDEAMKMFQTIIKPYMEMKEKENV